MRFKQNESAASRRWIMFFACDDDSADAYAPKTGLSFGAGDLKVAKAGAAWANATGTTANGRVVEIGGGWYWYQFEAAELDTLGAIGLFTNVTDVYSAGASAEVVAVDQYNAASGGMSNLDATVSGGSGSAVVTALLAETIDGETIETILAIAGAVGAAKRSISGGTFILRDLADTRNLVSATVDGNGNVTAVTIG